MNETTTIHKFERAGLGAAPFRVVGYTEILYQACPGAPVQAGGSCAYCATGIRYAAKIKSADGKSFVVGMDCVSKTGDHGLTAAIKRSAEYKAHQRKLRTDKDMRVKAEIAEILAHPALAVSAEADRIAAILRMCGAAGRFKYLKQLRELLKEAQA